MDFASDERSGPKSAPQWIAELEAVEQARQASVREECEQASRPPNPLRVCHELGRRWANPTWSSATGATSSPARPRVTARMPQLWMDPGPLGTLGTARLVERARVRGAGPASVSGRRGHRQ